MKTEGRTRESADGLRRRDPELEKQRLREAQQTVAEEAQARRTAEQAPEGDD